MASYTQRESGRRILYHTSCGASNEGAGPTRRRGRELRQRPKLNRVNEVRSVVDRSHRSRRQIRIGAGSGNTFTERGIALQALVLHNIQVTGHLYFCNRSGGRGRRWQGFHSRLRKGAREEPFQKVFDTSAQHLRVAPENRHRRTFTKDPVRLVV